MEKRKQKEIEYYDKEAEQSSDEAKESGSRGGFNPFSLSSYNFLKEFLKNKCQGKQILDYGCGTGVHSVWLAEYGVKVTGIDLSTKSLVAAKERIKKTRRDDNIEFLIMDCEKMDFADNSFDIIFDGGTFSSIDLNKAYPELSRVLKPEGFLIGIETFGHNPFTNFKRRINKLMGKRTGWAAEHIFKTNDLKKQENILAKLTFIIFI